MARQQATKARAASTTARKRVTAAKPDWYKGLLKLGACDEALEFAKKYTTFADAWHACTNSHWLEWLCYELHVITPAHTNSSSTCWCYPADKFRATIRCSTVSRALNKVAL